MTLLRIISFDWDNGYGTLYPVRGVVRVDGEDAEIVRLDVETMHGGCLTPHAQRCVEEQMIEEAFQ